MLLFIAEYARRQAWREDGCTSMADRLIARLNIARRTANDLLRIAGRLMEQPAIASAMATAELSLDQVRATGTVDDSERQRRRSVRWWWDEDAGWVNLRGRL